MIGQVPVRVRGDVKAGDYIIPSGHEDGTGVGVAPEDIVVMQIDQIAGRALESREGAGVAEVKTLVGLPREQILQTMLERRDERLAQQEARTDELAERVAVLESQIEDKTVQKSPSLPTRGLPLIGGALLAGIIVWQRREREN